MNGRGVVLAGAGIALALLAEVAQAQVQVWEAGTPITVSTRITLARGRYNGESRIDAPGCLEGTFLVREVHAAPNTVYGSVMTLGFWSVEVATFQRTSTGANRIHLRAASHGPVPATASIAGGQPSWSRTLWTYVQSPGGRAETDYYFDVHISGVCGQAYVLQ